ncbi:hypothetical protein N425_08030 [Tannerella sp. oral taxon BU063 isolate Cell 2]|uniref:Uncharacterized protein n=1 Tax=Tannerella sp. oral taxon BU063 isolate Cell 2 TaxID=1411148 RepID=W2C3W0_9BACT|nr:hypothetical protein N425_08030 [Tannerella sp. oral taxon BU063 isolate Cell 2]
MLVPLLFVKQLRGLHQQGDAFFFSVGTGADPMLAKVLTGVREKSFTRVGDENGIAFPLLSYGIHHHEMLLIPVNDTGQKGFVGQFLESQSPADSTESDLFSSFADT